MLLTLMRRKHSGCLMIKCKAKMVADPMAESTKIFEFTDVNRIQF